MREWDGVIPHGRRCGNHAATMPTSAAAAPPPWPPDCVPTAEHRLGRGVHQAHAEPIRGALLALLCKPVEWLGPLCAALLAGGDGAFTLAGAKYLGRTLPPPPCLQAFVALGAAPAWWEQGTAYPMDYYAADGGEWNSTYHRKKAAGAERVPAAARAAAALAARRPAAGAEGAAAAGGAPP